MEMSIMNGVNEQPHPSARPQPHLKLYLAIALFIILTLNFGVRRFADQAGKHVISYIPASFQDRIEPIHNLHWWQYFLPVREMEGRWGTTGFLLVYALERQLGEPVVFYLLNAVMVSTGFVLSWLVFRSVVFTLTAGFCLALTTFNYHVYAVSGSVIILLLVTFAMLFSYCQYQLFRDGCNYRFWIPLTGLALLAFATCYEGWLDYVAFLWIAYPFLALKFFRVGDRRRLTVALSVWIITTGVALGYTYIKAHFSLAGLHPRGGEADLILTYGKQYGVVAAEDVVSHFFTFFQITVTTYAPPQLFVSSISLWKFGPERLVQLQEGYHPLYSHLVVYNHLFLWRYYAGFGLAVFLYIWFRVGRAAWERWSPLSLGLFLFMALAVIGSPTHMLIKWRPMHSTPFLGYQCALAILGWTAFLCGVSLSLWRKMKPRFLSGALIGLLWINLLYCAFARPALLSQLSVSSGLFPYPDPIQNLRALRAR